MREQNPVITSVSVYSGGITVKSKMVAKELHVHNIDKYTIPAPEPGVNMLCIILGRMEGCCLSYKYHLDVNYFIAERSPEMKKHTHF